MSGSDSEALSAIVVDKGIVAMNTPSEDRQGTKLCSSCKVAKPMSEFLGLNERNLGQIMKTCGDCRIRGTGGRSRLRGGVNKIKAPKVTKVVPESAKNEPGRNGRVTRRQTTTPLGAANKPSAGTPTIASKTMPPRGRKPAAVTTPVLTPTVSDVPAAKVADDNDITDTDEEYFQPPPGAAVQSLKRQSTPPHSAGEDMDHEDAIQVRPPPLKRQRMSTQTVQREAVEVEQREPEVEVEQQEEEEILNANGHPVGSDLAAFANSLGRLSQLLITAGKNLDNERIGALESEIHHDWRVDEMATFVEGFLKGASANSVGKGW